MARTTVSIRLVGGPRPLDASHYDLSLDDRDRADATGDRFVRAVRGTTVTSLSGLQAQCVDRARAEALAAEWRVAVFHPGIFRSCVGVELQLTIAPAVATHVVRPMGRIRQTGAVEFVVPNQLPPGGCRDRCCLRDGRRGKPSRSGQDEPATQLSSRAHLAVLT